MGYETSLHAPDGGHLCERCEETRPAFVRATAFGTYEWVGPVLRLFKFDGVRALERPLGEMLAEAIVAQAEGMPALHKKSLLWHGWVGAGAFRPLKQRVSSERALAPVLLETIFCAKPGMPERLLVVPVPLHGRRRVYNQSELLARGAVRAVRRLRPEWAMDFAPRCMKRIHHREVHYRLSPEERRENVRGAFRVQGNVRGRHVLLVDDVYTTGATVTECTETLLAAGAESVRVVTLARAGTEMSVLWTPRTQVRNSFEHLKESTLRH